MIRENNTLEWQETAEQKRMTQRRIIQRRERARRRKRKVWRIRGLLLLFGCLLLLGGVRRFRQNPIQRYAKANGISMDQYPEELLSLYERNNETETFVEEYPLKKEEEPEIDLSDLSSASEVPLLLQWDQAGNLIIALMGPGEFTSNGHFIVLTGLQNGRLKINDPNSRKNSEKTWDIDQVLEQTKAVWVYYK